MKNYDYDDTLHESQNDRIRAAIEVAVISQL